jgi:23S rRNA (guanosine2251-2'-O)-methyltransferase
MIIYGLHACSAALSNPSRVVEKIFLLNRSVLNELPNVGKRSIEVLDKPQFDKIVGPQAVHQGVALRVQPLPEQDIHFLESIKDTNQIIVVLDHVTDPHNVGAILRSAAAFGARALIQTQTNAPKENATMAKTASGALDLVPICSVGNLARALEQLKAMGFWVIGFAEGGKQSLSEINLKGKTALVMGAEGEGMRRRTQELCDHLVYLPTSTEFSTLNVSNAAAVALYEAYRQQNKAVPVSP